MTRTRLMTLAACALALIGAAWVLRTPAGFALLTAEEIATHAAAQTEKERGLDLTVMDGPSIRVAAPVGDALVSPVNFDITIEPRDGVPVDMTSIRIDYRLGPSWVNMTNRILKYAKVKGSRLRATGAELPAGNHALRVSVVDAKNRKTQATVTFSVAR